MTYIIRNGLLGQVEPANFPLLRACPYGYQLVTKHLGADIGTLIPSFGHYDILPFGYRPYHFPFCIQDHFGKRLVINIQLKVTFPPEGFLEINTNGKPILEFSYVQVIRGNGNFSIPVYKTI